MRRQRIYQQRERLREFESCIPKRNQAATYKSKRGAVSLGLAQLQYGSADDPGLIEFLLRYRSCVLLHAYIIAAAWWLFRIVNARRAVDLIIEDNLANIGCTQNEPIWTGWSPE